MFYWFVGAQRDEKGEVDELAGGSQPLLVVPHQVIQHLLSLYFICFIFVTIITYLHLFLFISPTFSFYILSLFHILTLYFTYFLCTSLAFSELHLLSLISPAISFSPIYLYFTYFLFISHTFSYFTYFLFFTIFHYVCYFTYFLLMLSAFSFFTCTLHSFNCTILFRWLYTWFVKTIQQFSFFWFRFEGNSADYSSEWRLGMEPKLG